jgi:hypothetical protein
VVCHAALQRSERGGVANWWRCYRDTVSDAVSQIGNARLTATHVQRSERKKSD